MLITPQFTYIHQPKTGGTFVTATLVKIHEARGDRIETVRIDPASLTQLPNVETGLVLKLQLTTRDQHGRYRDIPVQYRNRPVVATIRNPYDRYVSQYEFAWWRTHPEMFGPVDEVTQAYPRYPDITFADFVHLSNKRLIRYHHPTEPEQTPGFHTQQFVDFYFRDPGTVYPLLTEAYIESSAYRNDMCNLRLLDQTNLNQELHEFLLSASYAPAEIEFVRTAEKVFPPEGGRTPEQRWERYYTPELKAFVRQREGLLFALFPRFDV
ncbi:MAG: hypothetical protein GEV06_10910 [Luteitalea sp.]|nr:hypothetical protein [Luteitalea sp.]